MRSFVALLASLILFAAPLEAADHTIGETVRSDGLAQAFKGRIVHDLSKGSLIAFDDRIITGKNTRVQITFKDKSELYLGDDSDLIIDDFVYSPEERNLGVMTLTKGVFRLISGQLNKTQGSLFALKTPLATIGIRGTDFWGVQTPEQLKVVLLDKGRLEISTPTDDFILDTPLSGVLINSKGTGQPLSLNAQELQTALESVQ